MVTVKKMFLTMVDFIGVTGAGESIEIIPHFIAHNQRILFKDIAYSICKLQP
jgi:hypothetical protein